MEASYFTILYWFCHTSTWICHGCTCVPHPEPPTHHRPRTIPQGHPSAPTSSILYPASNLDWQFVPYMILYMFQCHSPKFSSSSLSAIKSLSPPCKQLLLLFLFSIWENWLLGRVTPWLTATQLLNAGTGIWAQFCLLSRPELFCIMLHLRKSRYQGR